MAAAGWHLLRRAGHGERRLPHVAPRGARDEPPRADDDAAGEPGGVERRHDLNERPRAQEGDGGAHGARQQVEPPREHLEA